MAREIILADGKITLVSDEDFAYLVYWPWHSHGYGYPMRREGKTHITMHSVIAKRMGIVGMVDHKDRNPLNNQRDNLRLITHATNKLNSELVVKSKTGYRGVYEIRPGRFRASITVGDKTQYIGTFSCPKQAAVAYNNEAKKHFGDFAVLNEV